MLSTKEVIRALQDANPRRAVSEDTVRVAIRRGKVKSPSTFAGRLAWTSADVAALAKALGLRAPAQPHFTAEVGS
jgi:hypothetical protein